MLPSSFVMVVSSTSIEAEEPMVRESAPPLRAVQEEKEDCEMITLHACVASAEMTAPSPEESVRRSKVDDVMVTVGLPEI